jgi:hypothetical protein
MDDRIYHAIVRLPIDLTRRRAGPHRIRAGGTRSSGNTACDD